MSARPFEIHVAPAVVADLKKRLARTRWPDHTEAGWGHGSDLGYMKELVDYWQNG
jgi:epoxide hydrolase